MPSLLKSSRTVSILTMLSRVLGLVREQLLAALLAAGPQAEAYNIAFRIPNLLRDLFAEGALSAAFVPTFARVYEQRSKEEAFVLGQRVLGALFIAVGVLTVLAYVGTVPLVELLAPGFQAIAGKSDLTVALTRVMLPFLMFLSFAAVAMGMLNAQHIYGPPALAPSAFNLAAIITGFGLAFAHVSKNMTAWGWSFGVVVGGFAQFAVQLPRLRETGFKFRLRFHIDDDVKHMLKLMAPAAVGLASTQINIVVNSRFASSYPGAVSWLNYAFRLLYLPIGVFGVAIATVSTSRLSRQVAAGNEPEARATLRQALALLAFLTLPSSVGLWVLGRPIIAMIYQRRAFSWSDSVAVGHACAVYAVGLCAYSAVKVLAPVYYARQRTHIPLIASASAVAANIFVSYWLRADMGFAAMALGTSTAAWVNSVILYLWLGMPTPAEERGERRAMFVSVLKSLIASAVMGAFAWQLVAWVDARYVMRGELGRWGFGLGAVAASGVVFAAAALLLRIPEATLFVPKRFLSRRS